MTAVAVVGSQWGDEGKGKITDFLSKEATMAVRSNGGNNAGHTIEIAGQEFKMRLIPSGIFAADQGAVIGNGVVINPEVMFQELDNLEKNGIDISKLRISNRAHIIMPYDILQDEYQEETKGANKIGTTKNGIGPTYMDKASRIGIRVCDLLEKDTFEEKLRANLEAKNALFTQVYGKPALKFEDIFDKYYEYGQRMKPYVTDTSVLVNDALDKGEKVLFEGAQGIMLDIDEGTYPFVTSSNTISGGLASGIGVGANRINTVIGVCKAYTTRVGAGPFPTELHDEIGDRIRETAHEYGTVTGRPRRVGWFDSVALRHAKRVAGITGLSLNLLDIFSGFDTVKVATAYELDGKEIDYYPASLKELDRCHPVYEELPAWQEDITQVKSWDELPENAKKFLNRIVELVGVPLVTVSVGPDREQTIVLKNPWEL
ncbi:adenylosuccinate synthase [Lactobacillus gigeriorum]|uniref:Adenylosuccinate synthetase n=1 Tax=Lactobacillus gigeriorum DSM 23908 = CRBIP 24.85 TaxID=1423751 RepID=I7KP55_9LACO|nr:adenylosuccinate synthase [Lactobacillus gigeriorum]KRN09534.1 adenylosuccinate synthetase [Lactobacillus gigeriorum DSM 23908 = CRBIP 24.85]CCI87144.1 Adenylosuccinate synthetase [Lactobacillus gigeriorum DSM 23908 = CRBIP 24.85]